MKPNPIKIMTTIALTSMPLLIGGCLSVATLGKANKTRYKDTYTTVDKDIIRQMAIVNTVNVTNTKGEQQNVVFFGDKYAYLIDKGAEDIKLIAQLEGRYLQFESPIYVNQGVNNELRSFLQFTYRKTNNLGANNLEANNQQASTLIADNQKLNSNYSAQELNILNQFCNVKDDTKQNTQPKQSKQPTQSKQFDFQNQQYYQCQLYIDGTLYQPSGQPTVNVSLKQGLPIVIQQVATRQYKQRANLLALPLTAVVDVVTLPFQMVGVGATLAVMHE